jgi:hypothetical protein
MGLPDALEVANFLLELALLLELYHIHNTVHCLLLFEILDSLDVRRSPPFLW